MKEMRNIADRGGKHHDPMHGPFGTWVYGLEGVGTTVGGEQEMPEARTPEDFSRPGGDPGLRGLSAATNPLRSYRHFGGRSRP